MLSIRRLVILFMVCLIPQVPIPIAAAAATPSRFGAVESYYRPTDAAALGVGWERIIFEWRYLQPDGPSDWDTSHVPEAWLQTDKDAGREVVGLIKNAPYWATGTNLLGAVPLGLDRQLGDPDNYFAQFVKKLVQYYGPKWGIHHWIIYNEPDIRPEDTPNYEFDGGVEDYYHIVKTAWKVAHANDPKAVIHLAGFTWWGDVLRSRPLYLERFLRYAIKDPEAHDHGLFFDVLTIHVYTWTRLVWDMAYQLRSYPSTLGYPKPIWVDELNSRITQDGDWKLPVDDKEPVTLEQQSWFMVQSAALALGLGAERIGIYRLYDDRVPGTDEVWGLVRHDGTRRPAFRAYQMVIREMSGATSAQRVSKEGVSIVKLAFPDHTLTVLWNQTDKPIRVRTPAMADAVLFNHFGAPVTAAQHGRASEFTLPPCLAPCFVEGEPRLLKQTDPAAIYLLTGDNPVRLD